LDEIGPSARSRNQRGAHVSTQDKRDVSRHAERSLHVQRAVSPIASRFGSRGVRVVMSSCRLYRFKIAFRLASPGLFALRRASSRYAENIAVCWVQRNNRPKNGE
jgi:hypothetical protein